MRNALAVFRASMSDARHLSALHAYLTTNLRVPQSYDDILRSQIVYSVSAFDKLMHDIIRIGMLETFNGSRVATERFLSEAISLELHTQMLTATIPPRDYIFEQEIIRRHSHVSFQDPTKISEGLSLIWREPHKWTAIGRALGISDRDAKRQMRLFVTRRNAIVHESDINPVTGDKVAIVPDDANNASEFLEAIGQAIVGLVA